MGKSGCHRRAQRAAYRSGAFLRDDSPSRHVNTQPPRPKLWLPADRVSPSNDAAPTGPDGAVFSATTPAAITKEFALHVLFVCTGNICRSPTAERLASAYASEMHIAGFSASSAGTNAVIGHPMHAEAALVLQQLGGDPAEFAARQLTAKIASSADLILTMTAKHRDRVLELSPPKLSRTFTLTEASRLASDFGAESIADLASLRPQLSVHDRPDVPDPIGQSTEVFESIGTQIAELLLPVVKLCRPD